MRPLVSIAIPSFNESANLPILIERLQRVFSDLSSQYDFEVVVCDNGSTDNSFEFLKQLHQQDPRFKTIRLVRNFNMEGGMMAALSCVRGDACVIMSADLQDPPELIPRFLEHWRAGYENVYTVITRRGGESLFRRIAAQLYYRISSALSSFPIPRNSSDFRLVSRAAYTAFNALPERVRFLRTTWAWLGFASIGIEYERPPRTSGTSTFSALVTAPYAFRAILGSSFKLLRMIPLIGVFTSVVAVMLLVGLSVAWIAGGVPFSGFGSIVGLMLLTFGILMLFIGVLSEYVSMILDEVRQRPNYIVESKLGISPQNNHEH